MFDEVKKFVDESFENSLYGSGSVKHFEQTVYWIKKLKSDTDESMEIAAYAHDIERAFRKTKSEDTFKDKEFNDKEFLTLHQSEGARIIKEFLEKRDYPAIEIDRVCNMIRYHEEGGDEESDLLKDADSISYLEVNAAKHIAQADSIGRDKVKNKIDWMFDRISSDEARDLARPYYEAALKLL